MEEESINLQDYLDALLHRWWVLLLGPVLVVIVVLGWGLWTSLAEPEFSGYEATAVVLMEGAEPLAQFPELVSTRSVLEQAAQAAELPRSVDQFRRKVSALPVADTPLLQIQATDPDPDRAVAIANAVAQSLVDHIRAAQRQRNAPKLDMPYTELGVPRPGEGPGAVEALPDSLNLSMGPYIVSPAEVSKTPAENDSSTGYTTPDIRNLVIGAVLGGFLAIILVFGLEYIEGPIRSPEKLERLHGLYRLGILPRRRKSEHWPPTPAATAGNHPVLGEAIREVAASVALRASALETPVVAMVSPDIGDGRSSVVASLGMVLASPWKDVVLVDANFGRPSLHHHFGLDNSVGLSTFLLNPQLDMADIAQDTGRTGLKVITSGPVSPGLGNLLDSPRMAELWQRLQGEAHLALVDTPPLRAAADAIIIGSQTQGLVLLVNGETCRQEQIKGVLAKLAMTSTPLLGYIWNRMSPWQLRRYSSSHRYFQGLEGNSLSLSPGENAGGTAEMPAPSNGAGGVTGVGLKDRR